MGGVGGRGSAGNLKSVLLVGDHMLAHRTSSSSPRSKLPSRMLCHNQYKPSSVNITCLISSFFNKIFSWPIVYFGL